MDPISQFVVDHVIEVTAQLIMPIMLVTFATGIFIRATLYFIAKSEEKFSVEFDRRVKFHFSNPDAPKVDSFSRLVRILLTKTELDVFDTKEKYKRRSNDYITSLGERIFLIEDGIKRIIKDTLSQVRYLRREGTPNFLNLAKGIFEINPFFNKLIGVFPINRLNDLLNILPGLFIIGGIFGTFLGISKSLPDLGNMDLSNMEESKKIMDLFLLKISQAMVKSIIGIGFSVAMTVFNTLFSVEGVFYNVLNRYTATLEQVWNETTTNEPEKLQDPALPTKATTPSKVA